MYKQRQMKFTSTLLVLLATISCSVNSHKVEDKGIDTIVIEKQDTLFIDTLKKKVNAKNLFSPKCVSYPKWRES
ncbi:hypothetical protein [uncultured Mediterranean phage uvDeep-CGR2-KM21-C345]|nr:hypothetical protein [uncultured Mediterranean phage uvDeep-CGR2-KM21-C345]